jgi:AmiR/NasT family two-component response regulator
MSGIRGRTAAGLVRHRAEIDQATGMLTEQLGVNITDAFARLRAYAYANDLRLTDVAGDIVARRLRLNLGPGPSPVGNA